MSTMIVPAVTYFFFAVAFFVLMALMRTSDVSEMYTSSVVRFETSPWSQYPTRTLRDVRGGPDVYKWLREVFVNEVFRELPVDGQSQGYCTNDQPCTLAEGNAMTDDHCAPNLVKGTRNCPTHMSSTSDCCEPCVDSADRVCPLFNISSESYTVQNTTSVPDLSANCADTMPEWLSDLMGWTSEDDPSWTGTAPSGSPTVAPGFTFCPERVPKTDVDLKTRQAIGGRHLQIAHYNRVLMARMSLKRAKLVTATSAAYANAYPRVLSMQVASAASTNAGVEDRESFGNTETFQYSEGRGYGSAGAFVDYVDFSDASKEEMLRKIARLEENYWFDLQQSSFVLEMILFNGNVDKFLYVAFVFEHSFSGQTHVTVTAGPLNLTLHDTTRAESYVRFFLYFLIMTLFVYFVKNEFDDMSADVLSYFSRFEALIHLSSLILTATTLVLYLFVVVDFKYMKFMLPLSREPELYAEQFETLVRLSNSWSRVLSFTAFTACLIYVRLISLLTGLAPDSGVVFNTVHQVRLHLLGFLALFAVVVTGFCFGAYYIIGSRDALYSTILDSFLSTIRAIMRETHKTEILKAIPRFGFFFYVWFHLVFLIALQPLTSIILDGYIREKERMKQLSDTDRYPMKRFWRQLQVWIRNNSSLLNRIAVSLQQILFGSGDGGTMRINYEQVSALRDGRATRPRMRSVRYELKGEDYGVAEGNEDPRGPSKDVTLSYTDPFYPNGMMQYYVETVQQEGAAEENKVHKGFRLTGIQKSRGTIDREKFRDYQRFHLPTKKDDQGKNIGGGYGAQTHNILEDLKDSLPVTLEFEGGVKSTSRECFGLMLFSITFIVAASAIARVNSSGSLTTLLANTVVAPRWYEYKPERVKSLDTMGLTSEAVSWVQRGVLEGEYACSDTGSDADCSRKRGDWFLWSGEGSTVGTPTYSEYLPLSSTPDAAVGLSLGYIPLTEPASAMASVTNVQDGRINGYKVGLMPNNHIRMTMQPVCYESYPSNRFADGYPMRVHSDIRGQCSGQPCIQNMIEQGETCFDKEGQSLISDGKMEISRVSGVTYKYSKSGTYGNMGGLAVGFGGSSQEARAVADILAKDAILTIASSFVLEYANYNGNYDLFTYTAVKIDLLRSGMLTRDVHVIVFPLNFLSRGKYSGSGFGAIEALVVIYLVLCLVFLLYLLYDLFIQYNITKELQRPVYMFPVDFFSEDWWNFVDVTSMVFNVCMIVAACRFYVLEAQFNGFDGFFPFNSWTMNTFLFTESIDMSSVDQFTQFQQAAVSYELFQMYLGLNALFMLLRMVKYLGAFPQLRLIMSTIASSVYEVAIMTFVILSLFIGFMFVCHVRFGISFGEMFGTLALSASELFLNLLGYFRYTNIQAAEPIFMLFFFPALISIFYVLTTMYLAAVVYRWQSTRRDAQEFALHTLTTRIYEAFQPSKRNKEESENSMMQLTGDYWKSCGVLEKLWLIDEVGIIRNDGMATVGNDGSTAMNALGDGAGAPFENDEEAALEHSTKQFYSIFRKAHMDIASKLCAMPGGYPPNSSNSQPGAGVGLDDLGSIDSGDDADDGAPIELGIVEEKVPETTGSSVQNRLAKLLAETGHPGEEILLDALVTALESGGGTPGESANALEALQKFFLPMPMVYPKKVHEWGNFSQKKIKMERRLDLFFKLLQEETRMMHYSFLKESASAKERVLKQQSLVMTDYLEQLDERIGSLQEEIRHIETKSAAMRSHIAPLL